MSFNDEPRYFKARVCNRDTYYKFYPTELIPKERIAFLERDGYTSVYSKEIYELYNSVYILRELTEEKFNSYLVLEELVN